MHTIQYDIEKLIEGIATVKEELLTAYGKSATGLIATALFFTQILHNQEDLAKLLLRLSNVKPMGLYLPSVNEEASAPVQDDAYERLWSASAVKLMITASIEAQRLDDPYVGTGHILLGLTRLNGGIAMSALHNIGADVIAIRDEVEVIDKLVRPGSAPPNTPDMQLTAVGI